MRLNGAVALVTGGSGGLGQRIVRALHQDGCQVAAAYLTSPHIAQPLAAELSAGGPRVVAMRADVTDEAEIEALVARVLREFGRLDILVNDAAYNQWVAFPDLDALDAATWDRILDANLRGPFLLCRAAAPALKASGRGRIVNISSVAGRRAAGSSIAYCVSKAALDHLTRCLALALAPDVLVNGVAPGLMDGTRMTANLDPAMAEQARHGTVLHRATDKDDVAEQVVTLCRTSSTTGQVVVVDAGRALP